jgi:hypothetical protein
MFLQVTARQVAAFLELVVVLVALVVAVPVVLVVLARAREASHAAQ